MALREAQQQRNDVGVKGLRREGKALAPENRSTGVSVGTGWRGKMRMLRQVRRRTETLQTPDCRV